MNKELLRELYDEMQRVLSSKMDKVPFGKRQEGYNEGILVAKSVLRGVLGRYLSKEVS